MGFAANGLGIGRPTVAFGDGHGGMPGGGFGGGVEVDFAAFIIGPEGDAADDFGGGFVALGLEFGHVEAGHGEVSAWEGGEDFAGAEDVEPADGHGHEMTGAGGGGGAIDGEALNAGLAIVADAFEGGGVEDGVDEGAGIGGGDGGAGGEVLANFDGFVEVDVEGFGVGPLSEFGGFGGEVGRACGVEGLGGVEGVTELLDGGGGIGIRAVFDAEDADEAGLGGPVEEGAEVLSGAADLGDDDLGGEVGEVADVGEFGAIGGGALFSAIEGEDGEDEEGNQGHGAKHDDEGDAFFASSKERARLCFMGCVCHHNVMTWYRKTGGVSR